MRPIGAFTPAAAPPSSVSSEPPDLLVVSVLVSLPVDVPIGSSGGPGHHRALTTASAGVGAATAGTVGSARRRLLTDDLCGKILDTGGTADLGGVLDGCLLACVVAVLLKAAGD